MTREELEELYKYQLERLAGYYGLKLKSRALKADYVDAILEHFRKEDEAQEPQMSVRVKRIKELNRS